MKKLKASSSPDPTKKKSGSSTQDVFPIVGIGASAGGLEALEQFFTKMPDRCGLSFVVVQHLDPDHKGILAELIQRITEMHVYTVTDRMQVKSNCVYIIPQNTSMSILNRTLYLFEPIEARGLRLPIDYFFLSLAEDLRDQSIGIILSGMGSDGSKGLKAIREKGGLVLVQDPVSASFDSMPRNAMKEVQPDIVAPADELPAKLIRIACQPLSRLPVEEPEKDASSLEKIIILMRAQTGHDFSQYKKTTVYRRIERRMGIHQISKINSYVRYLQENPAEVDLLFNELLIGVTSFFRDIAVWDELKTKVLPALFEKYPVRHTLRAWIPGCSTGEEAYSLAMVFIEALEQLEPTRHLSLQIFASDLDNAAIEKARKGIFPDTISEEVSEARLTQFFVKSGEKYQVKTEIREMVIFALQNVIKDPPFTKIDILSCRNLLIYLDPDLQKKLLILFHYSLNPDGFLLLGSAETQGAKSDLFTIVDSKLRIYQHSGIPRMDELINFPLLFSHNKAGNIKNQNIIKVPDNLQTLTDHLLLQQFSPSGVLVTDQGDILYISGNTGRYLEPAAGKANMNIFAMAREGLRNELPSAFHRAQQNYAKVVLENIMIETNEGIRHVNVVIQQIEKPLALKGKILLIFHDILTSKSKIKKALKDGANAIDAPSDSESQRLKEELQSLREEMQTSQEELQSTNEELQSANEELTTSKEEMQSLNEELHTVNSELQSKVDDYTRVNNDLNNLLNSLEIAILFLNKELKIRQFTAMATKIFKFIPGDIGRLFTDQVTDLDYPEMYKDAKEVLRSLVFIEKEVRTYDGRWFKIRIMPYRTVDDRIDGLVLTFIDITERKEAEEILREAQSVFRSLIHALPAVVLGLSAEGSIIEFNPGAEKLFGYRRPDVMGKNYFDTFVPEASRKKVKADIKKLLTGALPRRYKNPVKAANGKDLLIEWTAHRLLDERGKFTGIITVGENITKQ